MKTDGPASDKDRNPPGVSAEIDRLLAAGKCKQAVELGKEHHKRVNTPESQALLVRAYLARIEQFNEKGMSQEAQTLLTLVQQRFPTERHRLAGLEIRAAAASGRVDDLLRPLAAPQTSAETRTAIEAAVARHVTDLPGVSSSGVLAPDHPLRIGAAALWKAFLAVTSGPVTDEQIALPEIARRSPLAAWKMLIRAIALFYRRDDAGCRRSLDAIPADSATAHVAATVRGLVDGNKPAAGVAGVLYTRVVAGDEALRTAMQNLESAYRVYDLRQLINFIREVVRLCAQARPELLERLRQHIAVACAVNEVPIGPVLPAIGFTPKNASFWRMLARASAVQTRNAVNVVFWERFLAHAVDEGLFAETSEEAAVVWLHIARSLSAFSAEQLEEERENADEWELVKAHYKDQPPEIARLQPESEEKLIDEVIQPGFGFRQAAKIQPHAETFAMWWAWAGQMDLPDKQKEEIALEWAFGRPRDVKPLVELSSLAESRGALSLAMKRLGEAEAIDPLSQEVREARVRLTLSIAWRHFADRKPHLVEKDLADLASLPSMAEGDRGAALESMRGAWHAMRGDASAEAASQQAVIARVGPIVGPILFNAIKAAAKQANPNTVAPALGVSEVQPLDIAMAQAKIVHLAEDLGLKMFRPMTWNKLISHVLSQRPCPLGTSDILLIGRGAIATGDSDTAYQASAAGLARGDSPNQIARFLMLRAKSLDPYAHVERVTQCLRAALDLARQAHDEELVRDIFTTVDQNDFVRRHVAGGRDGRELTPDVLQAVLDNEKKAETHPRKDRGGLTYIVKEATQYEPELFGGSGFDGGYDFAGGGMGWEDEEDEDDGFDLGQPRNGRNVDAAPELTPREFAAMEDFLDKSGATSPEDVLKNPRSFLEALANLMGKKPNKKEMDAIEEELKGKAGEFAGVDLPDLRSKKGKKRRR